MRRRRRKNDKKQLKGKLDGTARNKMMIDVRGFLINFKKYNSERSKKA